MTGDIPSFREAVERYASIFHRANSAVSGIRAELHMIHNDSMLPINRDQIDAIDAQLAVAELALDALAMQMDALWRRQKAKED